LNCKYADEEVQERQTAQAKVVANCLDKEATIIILLEALLLSPFAVQLRSFF
jgi:hypothetical protein